MKIRMPAASILVGCVLFVDTGLADDWPQWLGPKRDSVWRAKGIVKKFPKKGLPVRWRAKVGGGYTGPAVADGRVFVIDYVRAAGKAPGSPVVRSQLEGTERVLCLNAEDGSLVWKHEYACPYRIAYPGGPRTTPTVDGNKVYTLGAEGHLFCFDVVDGKVLWSKQLQQEYHTKSPLWGFCGHPLVDGRKLICLVGGAGSVAVAFDKISGEELWRSLSAKDPGYCPPTLITVGGKRQLVIWHAEAINGLNPETGEAYWSVPLKPDYGMSITTPRQYGNFLFASGHVKVGALLKLDAKRDSKPAAKIVWRGKSKTAVYCCNSVPFIADGIIYGVCASGGQLRAVELKTGKRLWETFAPTTGRRRASHATAFLVRHEDRFFLFNEKGDLILARLNRKGYEEISRFHVLEPTNAGGGRDVVWSHPAFANQSVYARNDKELVCVSLAAD